MALYVGTQKIGNSVPDVDKVYSWTPPSCWPNIRNILDSDKEPYEYKAILLLRADYPTRAYSFSNDKVDNYIHPVSTVGKTFAGFKASDTNVYEAFNSTENNEHVWDATKDIDTGAEFKFRWIIFYSNKSVTSMATTGGNQSFYPGALWIHGTENISPALQCRFTEHLRAVTFNSLTFSNSQAGWAFGNCHDLEYVPPKINMSNATTAASMFESCFALRHVPHEMDLRKVTSAQAMFYNCTSLMNVPDELDMPLATTAAQMFQNCCRLKRGPKILNLPICVYAHNMFQDCKSIVEIPHVDCRNATRYDNMFINCYALKRTSVDLIDVSHATNVASMFSGCFSLRELPKVFDVSKSTNCQNLFYDCNEVVELPDVLDFSACTSANSVSGVFNTLYNSALRFPSHVTLPAFNFTINQWLSVGYLDISTFASFDDNGVVNGGFVHNLNSISSAATLTINAGFKNRLTSDQQTAVATCLTAKGWTVSW